jgi:hypothetical protein
MFDLYRLPKDFPQGDALRAVVDTNRRVELLEAAMFEAVNDPRLLPYVQRHELEALVLASLSNLAAIVQPEDRAGVAILQTLLTQAGPEDIDDGPSTAPSKRLRSHVPSHRKTVHGLIAVDGAGLDTLRSACPRFAEWVSKLESLGTG